MGLKFIFRGLGLLIFLPITLLLINFHQPIVSAQDVTPEVFVNGAGDVRLISNAVPTEWPELKDSRCTIEIDGAGWTRCVSLVAPNEKLNIVQPAKVSIGSTQTPISPTIPPKLAQSQTTAVPLAAGKPTTVVAVDTPTELAAISITIPSVLDETTTHVLESPTSSTILTPRLLQIATGVTILGVIGILWLFITGIINTGRSAPLNIDNSKGESNKAEQGDGQRSDVLFQPDKNKVIKILFLAANPSETTRLRIDEEMHAIDTALQASKYRDVFDIKKHTAVRVDDLSGLLLRHQPDIVHFSGHGSPANEIILDDQTAKGQPVTKESLSHLFATLSDNIRCVVLNACYSESQAQAIAQHIDCVIGMSTAISDTSAISFSASFYQALGYGRDIQTAFELGCVQLDLKNLGEQDTPRIIADRTNPKTIFFVT